MLYVITETDIVEILDKHNSLLTLEDLYINLIKDFNTTENKTTLKSILLPGRGRSGGTSQQAGGGRPSPPVASCLHGPAGSKHCPVYMGDRETNRESEGDGEREKERERTRKRER